MQRARSIVSRPGIGWEHQDANAHGSSLSRSARTVAARLTWLGAAEIPSALSTNGREPPAMKHDVILVDEPAPLVRRITMNRPEKRNALIHPLRGAILNTLRAHDQDPTCASRSSAAPARPSPPATTSAAATRATRCRTTRPAAKAQWPRHVTEGWMSIWDLAKPVIAQVHGYCLAGGSELATGCDLVYVAEDAQMGYPAVRFGVPDMHFHAWLLGMRTAMEMMLTGDSISASRRSSAGGPTAAFPADELDDAVARGRRSASRRCRPSSCSSTSASCTARWTPWACAPASAPAPSCARSARTPRPWRDFVGATSRTRASPARSPSATPSSATTARNPH